MARPRLVKLVRDRVGGFLPEGYQGVEYRPINDDSVYLDALRAKLVEEVGEYLRAPCIGELADVLEVVQSLAMVEFGPLDLLDAEATSKRHERGGFLGRVGMYVETTAPTRHEPVHALPPEDGRA